jgi:hypothetical protein
VTYRLSQSSDNIVGFVVATVDALKFAVTTNRLPRNAKLCHQGLRCRRVSAVQLRDWPHHHRSLTAGQLLLSWKPKRNPAGYRFNLGYPDLLDFYRGARAIEVGSISIVHAQRQFFV